METFQSNGPAVATAANASPTAHLAPDRRHKGKLVVVLLVLALAAIVVITYLRSGSTAAPRRVGGAVSITAASVRRQNLPIYLSGLGTVTPYNTVAVQPRVNGQIMKIGYREGQDVKAGQFLLQIDPRPYQVQLMQAQGQLAKDKATLKNDRLNYARYKLVGNAASAQQRDAAAAAVAQDTGAIAVDQAQISNAQLQLTYCRIVAPISGRVGLRLVDVGNIVNTTSTSPLVVITQVRPITVVFTLPEETIPTILQAMKSGKPVPTEIFGPDLQHQIAVGTLLAIDNQVDLTTGTIRLRAKSNNEKEELFPNEFVNVKLLVKTLPQVLTVPVAAVQRGPDSTFAYVVGSNGNVHLVNVKAGPATGGITSILSGLSAGQRVVTSGVEKLRDGSKVIVRKAPGAAGQSSKK